MDIRVFHLYNRLVRRGLAEPITCPDCGFAYVLRSDRDGNPELECLTDDTVVKPGLRLYSDVKNVVEDYF